MTMTDVHVSIEIQMDFYISEQHLVARQWVKKDAPANNLSDQLTESEANHWIRNIT